MQCQSESMPIRGLIKHQLRRFILKTPVRLMTSTASQEPRAMMFPVMAKALDLRADKSPAQPVLLRQRIGPKPPRLKPGF